MNRYCLILGEEFEDIEALAQIDLLRRAGIPLDIYGIGSETIRSRSGIIYHCEKVFRSEEDMDAAAYAGILLPGGPAVKKLLDNIPLLKKISEFFNSGKLVFAICAAPELLDKAGLLKGKTFTCFPDSIPLIKSGNYVREKVVVDGTLVTSMGAGTAIDAALKLIELILSKEKAAEIAGRIVYGL